MEYITELFPFTSHCHELAARALCTYYYLPCGYNDTIHVPRFLCSDVCEYVQTQCSISWSVFERVASNFESDEHNYDRYLAEIPNCNATDVLLKGLNLTSDCCSTGGIVIPTDEGNNSDFNIISITIFYRNFNKHECCYDSISNSITSAAAIVLLCGANCHHFMRQKEKEE